MQLAPHIRIAEVDGDLVFLDLAHDGYLCVSRDHSGPIRSALADGRSVFECPIVDELVGAGLLVAAVGIDRPPFMSDRPLPSDLAQGPIPFGRLTSLGHVLSIARIALSAAWRLRRKRPLAWTRPPQPRRNRRTQADAQALARQFRRLRCLIPRTGRCLPQSLMLRAFLSHHGIAAQLVLGVRTHPFEAHCWVEAHGHVLNDSIDHVRWFRPIAAF